MASADPKVHQSGDPMPGGPGSLAISDGRRQIGHSVKRAAGGLDI